MGAMAIYGAPPEPCLEPRAQILATRFSPSNTLASASLPLPSSSSLTAAIKRPTVLLGHPALTGSAVFPWEFQVMSVRLPRFVRGTLGATAVGAASLLAPAQLATTQLRAETIPLAITGQAAPGGGKYVDFSLVKLNDNGQVAFQAVNDNNFVDHGVYRAQRGEATTVIARSGQAVAGGTLGLVTYSDINNLGEVVMLGELTGTPGGASDDRAIYTGSGYNLKQLVREGTVFAPSGYFSNGAFGHKMTQVEDLGFFEGATINDWGQVAFVGNYSYQEPIINGSVTVHKTAGMRANQDGTVTISLVQGSAAPLAGGGTSSTIDTFRGAIPLPMQTALVNKSGHTLYRTELGATPDEGMFWTNNGFNPLKNKVRAVARNGQTLHPGAPGTIKVLSGSSPWYASHAVDMNDAGEVAFTAELNAPTGGNWDIAVYRWSPTEAAVAGAHGLTEIARLGAPSPDGDGAIGNIFFATVDINNRGQIAFESQIKNSAFGANDIGIFLGDGQQMRNIVRMSTKTPDGERIIGLPGASAIANDIAVNDSGQVAFISAVRDNHDEFKGHGIFISDGIDLVEVARVGKKLAGSDVESLNWIQERGINKHGQVAFNASLENGQDGVFLYTLDEVRWRSHGSGAWDFNQNWTLSTQPGAPHNIVIDTADAVTVGSPATTTEVRSLTVGSEGGEAELNKLEINRGVRLGTLDHITLNDSSIIDLEVAGPGAANYGTMRSYGNITAGGVLELTLTGGYEPLPGQLFDFFNADEILGAFDSFKFPTLATGKLWSTDRLYSEGVVIATWEADFDEDGDVDDHDLALLKGGMGSTAATHRMGDSNGDLLVNGLDFMAWQRQVGFKTTLPPLEEPADFAAVPEPATALLAVLAGIVLLPRRRR
jgi:hypothetical protein